MNVRSCGRYGALALIAVVIGGCAHKPRGTQGPSVEAIDSAMTITFPSDRLQVLGRIAGRDDLTPSEQIYLVNAILAGGFSEDQADALIRLIRNPVCTPKTRAHISRQLRYRHLGIAKERVINELVDAADTSAAGGRSPRPGASP